MSLSRPQKQVGEPNLEPARLRVPAIADTQVVVPGPPSESLLNGIGAAYSVMHALWQHGEAGNHKHGPEGTSESYLSLGGRCAWDLPSRAQLYQ